MATDKIVFDVSVKDVNTAYKPIYAPLYSIFTKTQKYQESIGQITFRKNDIVGDLDAKELAAQGTERKHFATGSATKTFNKYIMGISYTESGYQQSSDIQKLAGKVLDHHAKQLDAIVFTGHPDASGALRNNGILNTADPNAITKSPYTFSDTSINAVAKFFAELLKESEDLTGNAGKVILLGGKLRNILSNFVGGTAVSYKKALEDIFPVSADIIALPSNLDSIAAVGDLAIVLSLDDITFNYIAFPQLEGQGYDERNKESWFNFFFGSAMVDLEVKGALIKQAVSGL
jgi:hypothetical protein